MGPHHQTDSRARDRGNTLAFVAMSMGLMLAFGALAVDVSHGWRVKRSLTSAVDAAAMAGVQEAAIRHAESYKNGGPGSPVVGHDPCSPSGPVVEYLTANRPTATLASPSGCDAVGIWPDGTVEVSAVDSAPRLLSRIFGGDSIDVAATSKAKFGRPATIEGFWPLGLCHDAGNRSSPSVATVADALAGNLPAANPVFRVDYIDASVVECGEAIVAGGRGWHTTVFGGVASDFNDLLLNGESTAIALGVESGAVSPCVSDGCYQFQFVEMSGFDSDLATLKTSRQLITVPVIDHVTSSVVAHISGVLRVRLVDFNVTGDNTTRYLEFEVDPGLVKGRCCNDDIRYPAGNSVIALCSVNGGDGSC